MNETETYQGEHLFDGIFPVQRWVAYCACGETFTAMSWEAANDAVAAHLHANTTESQ